MPVLYSKTKWQVFWLTVNITKQFLLKPAMNTMTAHALQITNFILMT